jgi:hypothetical protein
MALWQTRRLCGNCADGGTGVVATPWKPVVYVFTWNSAPCGVPPASNVRAKMLSPVSS